MDDTEFQSLLKQVGKSAFIGRMIRTYLQYCIGVVTTLTVVSMGYTGNWALVGLFFVGVMYSMLRTYIIEDD